MQKKIGDVCSLTDLKINLNLSPLSLPPASPTPFFYYSIW